MRIFALILSLLCVNAYAVKLGDDESVVLTELGKPNSEVKLSPTKKIIGYERGDIVISQGKVVKIDLITIEQLKARQNSDSEIRKANEIKPKIEEPNIIQVPEANPLKDFASSICFIPEKSMDNHLGLGRVDVVASGSDLILVLDIIDNSARRGGSNYYATVCLSDSGNRKLAVTNRGLLPIGGGKISVPVRSFILFDENYNSSRENHPTTTAQQIKLLSDSAVITLTTACTYDDPFVYHSIKQSTK